MLATINTITTKTRKLTAKQLEDRADYRAAVKASRSPGKAIPLEEIMKRYGLEY